jgi:3-dehydrosphinganine reductase
LESGRPHALISGGSSGIGLALAGLLAGQGWNLTLIGRDPQKLAAARDALAPSDAAIHTAAADVRDEAALSAAIAGAIAELGPPLLAVASAGIVLPGLFAELPQAAHRDTMDINFHGAVHLARAVLPSMGKGGRIVLISSGAGLVGLYGYSAYAPSKFALRGFAEVLRGELKPDGIGVSIVYPPDTDTPQLREEVRVRPDITSRLAGGARVQSAEEVAKAILKGVERGRFTIAPGWEMGFLARLQNLAGPLLHRFAFDPVIARHHGRAGKKADAP